MKKAISNKTTAQCQLLFCVAVLFVVLAKGQTELSDCSVDIDTGWTVRGSCHYTKADVSRIDDINCTWYRQHNLGSVSLLTDGIVTGQLIKKGGKTFYSGTCSFSVTVSAPHQGVHTFYIDFVPGPGRVATRQIELVEPGKPETNCLERTVFPEGQDRSCDCNNSKSQPGSPPPSVGWRGLAPGQPLLLRDIKRSPIESTWICEMRWGAEGNSIVKTTSISTVIVYGPDRVTISDRIHLTGAQDLYEGQTAVWKCKAYSASIAVGISWTGIQCDNGQKSRDCGFTAGREDDGKTVTCTGTNVRFPDVLHASTSVKLNVKSGEKINVGAVVGGCVAAVVVIVTVVVVVVFVKRYLGRSIYAKPGPRLQESNYTDLVINDTVGDTNRASSHENKAANNDYENSGDKRTPGDDVHYQNTGTASQTEGVYEDTSQM